MKKLPLVTSVLVAVTVIVGCRDASESSSTQAGLLNVSSEDDFERIVRVGMSTNDIIAQIGAPIAIESESDRQEDWFYAVTPFPGTRLKSSRVEAVRLLVTNGLLAECSWIYVASEASTQSDLVKKSSLNMKANALEPMKFYALHDEPIANGRYIDELNFSKLGYIAKEPDLVISQFADLTVAEYVATGRDSERTWEFKFTLNESDTERFSQMTVSNHFKRVAVISGGEIISAPTINNPVFNGVFTLNCDNETEMKSIKKNLGLID